MSEKKRRAGKVMHIRPWEDQCEKIDLYIGKSNLAHPKGFRYLNRTDAWRDVLDAGFNSLGINDDTEL